MSTAIWEIAIGVVAQIVMALYVCVLCQSSSVHGEERLDRVASASTITVQEAVNAGSSTGFGIASNYGVTVACTAIE